MNVFEDLIEELKEENLLEETVIETSRLESYYVSHLSQTNQNPTSTYQTENKQENSTSKIETNTNTFSKKNFVDEIGQDELTNQNNSELIGNDDPETPIEPVALNLNSSELPVFDINNIESQLRQNLTNGKSQLSDLILQEEAELQALNELTDQLESNVEKKEVSDETELENREGDQFPQFELLTKTEVTDSEFFRRRATEEVTSLQTVEHIISAIEKEQMKIVPKPYDDLAVKMSLHDFLQIAKEPQSIEHAQAEFKLMQETESWYSALSHRDKHISVGDLRRYCENAKPALSSQALISLARFYRNSPFSEAVRSKFDMVVTKLMTKETWDDRREMVFNRDELINQLGNLYSDWSSIPLYETNEDDSDVLIGVLKFEDFILEAEGAISFEDLLKNDFFNRVRIFKESTNEKFFAPLLTATAIECNVIIGNKYVELLQNERLANRANDLEAKYKFLLDQSVSDAISKTLQLVEVLKEKKEPQKVEAEQPKEIQEVIVQEKNPELSKQTKKTDKISKFKVNKFLLAVVVLGLFSLAGLYIWAEYSTPQIKTSPSVKKVDLDNTLLKEYFKTARINKETFFAITEPSWDKLSNDVKEDVLKKTLAFGGEKGFNKIHVINSEGKTVAFASSQGITLDIK